MRYLITLSALIVALAASATASGGGWASVGFAPLPDGTAAGETWTPKITVLQHGRTPLGGLSPVVTITGNDSMETFTATETSEVGVYEASVVFPESADWRIVVDSGFGESNVTYGPVRIGSAPTGDPSSFPALPVGIAIVAGLALLAATTFGLLRQRRLTPAS
ncbi:MAG: hypothetical protein M3364_09460 [Actinomycetota bacterium]|nr:hypothetical protein [Actinomycetota bacterium]